MRDGFRLTHKAASFELLVTFPSHMRLALACFAAGFLGIGLLYPCTALGQRASGPSLSTTFRTSSPSPSEYATSVSKTLSFDIPLDDRQSLKLSAEYVKATSLPKVYERQLNLKPSWKFKAVPLTIGYSYALTDPDHRLVPIVGVGLSYYLCRSKRLDAPAAGNLDEDIMASPRSMDPSFHEGIGMGYGAQATLGLRFDLNRHLFLTAQSRARYVDGFAFTPGSDLGTEFTDVDFSLGFGFKL